MKKLPFIIIALISAVACADDDQALEPGDVFRDCDLCPQMVVLPKGKSFMMGTHPFETKWSYEYEWHEASINYSLAVGKFELLLEEYYSCVADSACEKIEISNSKILHGTPAYNLSWNDANDYVSWLATKTDKPYRLLSHTEWEYAARAGKDTRYWWGDYFRQDMAVCAGCNSAQGRATGVVVTSDGKIVTYSLENGRYISPAGGEITVPANPFGLFFMLGNVREWVNDCFRVPNVGVRPVDGSAWIDNGDCSRRQVMGHDYNDPADNLKLGNWAVVTAKQRRIVTENTGTRVALVIN